MEWLDLLTESYDRVPQFVEHVVKGLSQEDLDWRPHEDCNSIGWLIWHLTRQHDAQVASLMNEEQLWTGEEWHQKFSRPSDPDDSGFGQTPEQVAAYKSPESKILVDYQNAVTERSKRYFSTLTEKDLDRVLDEPQFQPLPTLGVRLVSIMEDGMLHAGQAAYLRGLRQGKGWQKY